MKIISMVVCIMFLFSTLAYGGIKISQEQFDNLDILHEKLKARYPQFKGFNGSKDNLEVIGISDLTASVEIENIDIPTELQKKKAEKQAKIDYLYEND